MGEETKPEEAKPAEAAPPEEKKEEAKPPEPFVIHVDLHCAGCSKKIQRYIMKIQGVEGVAVDMAKNQLTVKGMVDHQAVCSKITKKTKRTVTIISPTPKSEGETIPQVVVSQVDAPSTVELQVNMHCEGCAEQLKAKIMKMRGVQSVTTELSSGKVTVTGTMNPDKLVDYVYRRTKKQAQVVPQPEPEKKEPEAPPPPPPSEPAKEEKKEEEKPAAEEKKEEKPAAEEEKKEEKKEEKPEEKKEEKPPEEAAKKEEGGSNSETKEGSKEAEEQILSEEDSMKKMVYYYQPLYMLERMPPPPQLFSDENPNACCIS